MKQRYRIWLVFAVFFLAAICSPLSCTGQTGNREDIHHEVREEAKPYLFDFAGWEVRTLCNLIAGKAYEGENGAAAEKLKSQIESVIRDHSVTVFPPLQFCLEEPPHLLVVSPRDRIEYTDRVLLSQDLSMEDKENIEARVDGLGVSSLVVNLGGFAATYPPFVTDNAGIEFTINTIVEEWLHQYLVCKPLGFRYLLDSIGIRQDPDVIIMNETLAGIVSKEIGDEVCARYYGDKGHTGINNGQGDFDFDAEMRTTRKMVDRYLDVGDILGAERYMEAQRQVFVANGYSIRKLNQAYFAFHGIYGDDPASVSPINNEMEQLREKSPSLKEFLDKTSSMTSYADLKEALGEK
jgi:hypothetical protein